MDVFNSLGSRQDVISTVGMHTCGEPTRIVVNGAPALSGFTLLEKRECAKTQFDHIRRRLMLEPRGHNDMYGAILVQETEVQDAHIGVLFLHNEGFSTMCGHATIALGRFLVDTQDLAIFPKRKELEYDSVNRSLKLRLHAPCGLVHVSVPVLSSDLLRSDPSRPVSFISVPSFVAARDVRIDIPSHFSWPQLKGRGSVTLDIAYGGAFYALISAQELGFDGGISGNNSIEDFSLATRHLKQIIMETPLLRKLIRHPTERDLEFLYSVIVIDHVTKSDSELSELGLCFFADQQIDRSPTGSGVCARVALAIATGDLELNEARVYDSVVSLKEGSESFRGRAIERVRLQSDSTEHEWDAVLVEVEGYAYYTDCSSFITEEQDRLENGFRLSLPHNIT